MNKVKNIFYILKNIWGATQKNMKVRQETAKVVHKPISLINPFISSNSISVYCTQKNDKKNSFFTGDI